MSQLLDARGRPIQTHRASKIEMPLVDRGFGQWAGRDTFFASLPGGGILQFNLNRLTLADYRAMRQHYQLGASLNVLTFVMHQIDWRIDCENAEIKDFLEQDLREHWTRLIFMLSQSFWAGYSPAAVNYENRDGYLRLKQIKDLVPEECSINWKVENGWAPYGKPKPKLYSFDGIMQNGHEIPTSNSLWYPLLMENGDHWGRKLLKPAFPAWFFSNLIHLYANRYFERFGEPLPVGRAPFDEEVDIGNNQTIRGKQVMETIVSQIRNRSAVVLPSDRAHESKEYEWDIEYLESQMRGADFERYLSRLDEEMSLSVFTPILLFRTADVGSYNLGQAHLKIFEQMLNAIAGDAQFYIQRYLIDRMRVLNFGETAPRATWTYRRLGTVDLNVYKEIVVEIVRQGAASLDMEELGNIIGVSMQAQEVLTADTEDPSQPQPTSQNARVPLQEAVARAVRELVKGNDQVTFGFKNKYIEALRQDGLSENDSIERANTLYSRVNTWLDNVSGVFTQPDDCKRVLERLVELDA